MIRIALIWPTVCLANKGVCLLSSRQLAGNPCSLLQVASHSRKPFDALGDDISNSLPDVFTNMNAQPVSLPIENQLDESLKYYRDLTLRNSWIIEQDQGSQFPRVFAEGPALAEANEQWHRLDVVLSAFASQAEKSKTVSGVQVLAISNGSAIPQDVASGTEPVIKEDNGRGIAMLQEELEDSSGAAVMEPSFVEGVLMFSAVNIFCFAMIIVIFYLWVPKKGDNGDESDEDSDLFLKEAYSNPRRNISTGSTPQQHVGPQHYTRKPVSTATPEPRTANTDGKLSGRDYQSPGSSMGQVLSPVGGDHLRHLCPELVVPRGSECILAVRRLVNKRVQQLEFDVMDVNGKAVLHVLISPPGPPSLKQSWPTQQQPQRSPTVTLKSLHPRESTGNFILAYFHQVTKEDEGWGTRRNVYIYKEDDELFAHLIHDELRQRYVLTSGRLGHQLIFEGSFDSNAVNVTNESRELLAATEPSAMDFDPSNQYYKLRVAADVDVGLVLCGLLAIDQIEVR